MSVPIPTVVVIASKRLTTQSRLLARHLHPQPRAALEAIDKALIGGKVDMMK